MTEEALEAFKGRKSIQKLSTNVKLIFKHLKLAALRNIKKIYKEIIYNFIPICFILKINW